MNTFSTIDDDEGRFDHTERGRFRQMGIHVTIPQISVAEIMKEMRDISARITETDGIKNHAALQQMAAQRSRLTMQLPEIGF